MRIDRALLDRAAAGAARRPVLRIYGWSEPTLSVGAHQKLNDPLLRRCAAHGVEVVRRPTGGSAVLHGRDVTYAVVAPHGRLGVLDAYREVAGALIDGLARLGIEARVGTRRRGEPEGSATLGAGSACFATTLGADLVVGEAKICGSAQVRRQGWFLQHGSIPLADSRGLTRVLLGFTGADTSTCLERLRPGTSEDEVVRCLVSGFGARWGEPSHPRGDPAISGPVPSR